MLRVDFSSKARLDLDAILDFLMAKNPQAAIDMIDTIEKTIYQSLAHSPYIGIQQERLAEGLRVFHMKNYSIYYRVTSVLEIIRILHQKRDVNTIIK